ncbi:hypothetical protein [Algicella marina]|uniref:Uncharacterized protein n=1 Tax=Algicella marina TaxID=2683284 RepID=A0A6P1SXN1_9RHOB|nr:hypothetical protein [Algicella marina]QHQ35218.1 hypothetical protein GO499_08405 [Algicella marina]
MTDQTNIPHNTDQLTVGDKPARKLEHRAIAVGVAVLTALATLDLVQEENAGAAVIGAVLAMSLLWYALGGLMRRS